MWRKLSYGRLLRTYYDDGFALDDFELGATIACQHVIDTGDHSPIRQLPRRVSFTLRRKIDEMVAEMLKKGVIKPSKSPWASPVVLVSKEDAFLLRLPETQRHHQVRCITVA